MASTVYSLLAEIDAEMAKLGRQIEEESRLGNDIQQSIGELFKIVLSRQDRKTLNATADEVATMIQIYDNGEDVIKDITAKLIEATGSNPSGLHAALSEILEIAKRAKSYKAASIEELKRMQSRVNDLLDSAKPKA
jgi:hypothetical protein